MITMPDDPVFGLYHVSGLDANAVRAALKPSLRAAVAAAIGRDLSTDGRTMLWTRLRGRSGQRGQVMGFFDFLKPADPVDRAARRSARMLISWQKRHPGQPASAAIEPVVVLLRGMTPEGPRSAALDVVLSGAGLNVRELCRALVEIQTGISRTDTEAYARLIQAVDRELAAARHL